MLSEKLLRFNLPFWLLWASCLLMGHDTESRSKMGTGNELGGSGLFTWSFTPLKLPLVHSSRLLSHYSCSSPWSPVPGSQARKLLWNFIHEKVESDSDGLSKIEETYLRWRKEAKMPLLLNCFYRNPEVSFFLLFPSHTSALTKSLTDSHLKVFEFSITVPSREYRHIFTCTFLGYFFLSAFEIYSTTGGTDSSRFITQSEF